MRIPPAIRYNLFCFKEKTKKDFHYYRGYFTKIPFSEAKERKNFSYSFVNLLKMFKLVKSYELNAIILRKTRL